jgi:hypothetical protein
VLALNDLFYMHNLELNYMTLRLHKHRDSIVQGDNANVERMERLTAAASSAWRSEKKGSSISAFAALKNIWCHRMYSLYILSAFFHCMYSLYVLTVCSHYTYSLHSKFHELPVENKKENKRVIAMTIDVGSGR